MERQADSRDVNHVSRNLTQQAGPAPVCPNDRRAEREPEGSRAAAARLVGAGAVTLNGGPARPADEVRPGDLAAYWLLEPAVAKRVIFDLGLSRDIGYYTGAVFEIYDPTIGTPIGGGGRYDDLLRRFGRPLPAVGFALGLERFLWAIELAGKSEEARREGVQAIAIGSQALQALLPLVAGLRRKRGGPVFIDYGDRKLLAQLKLADRNNARYALILGEKELAEGSIVLRDLVTRMDRPLPLRHDTLEALGELKR